MGAGFYDYGDQVKAWEGLADLVPDRGNRVATADEIEERCLRALFEKAQDLMQSKFVSSPELCDLAFIMGIGFAPHLGGPIFYGEQQGWGG